MHDTRKALLYACLVSALVTFIIYLPSLSNGFVLWDDPKYVYENQLIRHIDLAFLKKAFTEVYFSNWHPLTMISYAVDYALWGLNPLGYHLENIILHAVNTALVAVLSIRLITMVKPFSSPAVFAAGFVPALLFGIHPLHVESVAWVSERKDVLSALFFILSVLSYLKYAQKNVISSYLFSLFLFALAIMSKSMAVTLPAVLLLLDFHPLGRFKGAKGVLKAFLEKLPFFAISAAAAAMAVYSQKKAIASLDAVPFDVRIYSALRAYVFYLEKLFFPQGLAPLYPYPTEVDPLGFEYLVTYGLLAGITVICLVTIRRRALIVAWLYFLGTLLPVIGIVQVGIQAAADRYMYLPSISLLVLLGAWAASIVERKSKPLLAFVLGFFLIATAWLSYATVAQSAIWKDSVALWDQEIRLYPGASQIAYVNRAVALKRAGRYREALDDLNAALDIKPTAIAYVNRGNVRKKMGDVPGAVDDYRKALELDASNEATLFNLALVLEETGDIAGAVSSAERAASLGLVQAREYLEHLRAGYPSIGAE